MSTNNESSQAFVKMRRSMWCTFWLFHFTRNRRTHTMRYHFWLKRIVGEALWPYFNPEFRRAWDGANGSFDTQYGLVLSLYRKSDSLKDYIESAKKDKQNNAQNDAIKKCIDEMNEIINNMSGMKESLEKIISIQTRIRLTSDEDARKLLKECVGAIKGDQEKGFEQCVKGIGEIQQKLKGLSEP